MKLVGIYYSHKEPAYNIGRYCRKRIADIADAAEMPMVYVVPTFVEPRAKDCYYCLFEPTRAGHYDISDRIATGCESAIQQTGATHVILFEHDVYYPDDYATTAKAVLSECISVGAQEAYMYNGNVLRMNGNGYGRVNNPETLTSQLMAPVDALLQTMCRRLDFLNEGCVIKWGEPGRNWEGCPDVVLPRQYWWTRQPAVDIRYGGNYTGSRTFTAVEHVEGLPSASDLRRELGYA